MYAITCPLPHHTLTLAGTISMLLACLSLLSPLSVQASTEQLLSASHTVGPPGTAHSTSDNAGAPVAAPPAPARCASFLLVVTGDGDVPVREAPNSKVVRFPLKTSSVVRLVNQATYDTQTWYLITPLNRVGKGWIPQDLIKRAEEVGPTFTNFSACTGSRHHPSATCGETLPRPTPRQDGLWLWIDFIGLNPNDQVQWVLTINGDAERYASPIVPWASGCAGQTLIALHELNPRLEPGYWTLWFFVNGEQVSMADFHVR